MDGTACVMYVERGSEVIDLKGLIEMERGIPQECIQLVVDTEILEDHVILGANGEETVSVVLVWYTERIYKNLESLDCLDMTLLHRALEALCKLAPKGDERAITAVATRLQHVNG